MIDITKKYKTSDGQEVRIYSTDGGGEHPVHGAVYSAGLNRWVAKTWTSSGYVLDVGPHPSNLVEVKPKVAYLKPLEKVLTECSSYCFSAEGDLTLFYPDEEIDIIAGLLMNFGGTISDAKWPEQLVEYE